MDCTDELKIFDDKLIKELSQIASDKIQYWDIKSGIATGTNLDFTDQKSKEISSFEVSECGIRSFINGGWGFITLKEITKKSIKNGFIKAIKLAKLSESLCKDKFKIKERDSFIKKFKISSKKKLEDISIEEKIERVKYHEKIASNYSPDVKNTRTFYVDGQSYNLFINSFLIRLLSGDTDLVSVKSNIESCLKSSCLLLSVISLPSKLIKLRGLNFLVLVIYSC